MPSSRIRVHRGDPALLGSFSFQKRSTQSQQKSMRVRLEPQGLPSHSLIPTLTV